MSLHKKIAKTVGRKVIGPAAKDFASGAKSTFKQTVGRGASSAPSLGDVLAVARRYNPVTGPVGAIKKVTRALNQKPPSDRRRN